MYELIVGGYIPGTNIQISYQAWLAFSALLFGLCTFAWLEHKDKVKALLTFLNFEQSTVAVHASELHSRVQYSA